MTNNLVEFLNNELKLEQYLNSVELEEFYNVISLYLNNRSKIETLKSNLLSLKKIFLDFNLSDEEIIEAIKTNSSYIHADKIELVIKFYLLGKIVHSETGKCIRKEIIVKKGKYLRGNFNLIYAKIKHIMYLNENFKIVRSENITARKIFKLTNEEFEKTYGLSREELLSTYPFTIHTIDEIKNWEENKYMIEEYEEKLNGKTK